MLLVIDDEVIDITNMSLFDIEMQVIFGAIKQNGGKKNKAAAQLGIAHKTIYNKLDKYYGKDVSDQSSRRDEPERGNSQECSKELHLQS